MDPPGRDQGVTHDIDRFLCRHDRRREGDPQAGRRPHRHRIAHDRRGPAERDRVKQPNSLGNDDQQEHDGIAETDRGRQVRAPGKMIRLDQPDKEQRRQADGGHQQRQHHPQLAANHDPAIGDPVSSARGRQGKRARKARKRRVIVGQFCSKGSCHRQGKATEIGPFSTCSPAAIRSPGRRGRPRASAPPALVIRPGHPRPG